MGYTQSAESLLAGRRSDVVEKLTFEEWWEDFLAQQHPREEGVVVVDRLRSYLRHMTPADRPAFERELVDLIRNADSNGGWDTAASALEGEASEATCRSLVALLEGPGRPAVASGDRRARTRDAREAAIIRVLAQAPYPEVDAPLREFFLEGPVSLYWSGAPSALWPARAELFAQAQARYFSEVDPETVRDTLVLQWFFLQPSALEYLKQWLIENGHTAIWRRLRAAIRTSRETSWLSPEQHAEVQRIVGKRQPTSACSRTRKARR